MGFADRDYQRQYRDGEAAFFNRVTPVVKVLLALNIGIYLLDLLLEHHYGFKILREYGIFSISSAFREHEVWRFVTFQFLHGSLGHVLFNSLGLFFFGPWIERWWGSAKFAVFYLLCGVAGALFFTLLVSLGILPHDGWDSGLLGASAGIYGILIGVAVIAPNLRVALLFPPIELSMRQLALALMAISAGSILLSLGGNEGGEAGHLGGAILGFFLTRCPWLLGKSGGIEISRPRLKPARPPAPSAPAPPAKLRPRVDPELMRTTRVDEILDKVSSQGIHSLTDEEREFLLQSSKKK